MKWLDVDRGFLDGEQMVSEEGVGCGYTHWLEESNMAILEDARGLLRMGKVNWQDYRPAELKSPLPPSPKPESLVRREQAHQHTLKERGRWP